MRHAAGQHPHGLHLLRLAELFFQIAAAGDIDEHREFRPAAPELNVVYRHLHVDAAVLARAMFPDAGGRAPFAFQFLREAPRLLRSLDSGEVHGTELVGGKAIEGAGRLVHREELLVLRVEDPHGLRVILEQQPEFPVVLFQ